jgi:eukaryotic-like serine/threonine-protein kinase
MTDVISRIGSYTIVEWIGRGGHGDVFLATEPTTDRRVALKLVRQGADPEAKEIVEAEQRGAKLQAQFSGISERVPAVYDQGFDGGYFFVAMEYLDGQNLADIIRQGPLAVDRAVDITIELCRFLEDTHRFSTVIADREYLSLVHGDLNPRNVRITSGQKVKVLDFGIAKALSVTRKGTQNFFGTRAYLSPERLDTNEVDEYADSWALGVILYEMVRGTPPFQAPDARQLDHLIRSRRPPAPLNGPAGLQAVVAKLLGPTPATRYANAGAIRGDLECVQSGAQTLAEREGWPNRTFDEPPTQRTRPPSIADDVTRPTRSSAGTPTEPMSAASAPAFKPPPLPGTTRRLTFKGAVRGVRIALIVIVLAMIANEASVGSAARRVAASLPTRELDQLDEVWDQYSVLAQRSSLSFGTIALERSLRERTIVLTDRVIANYRTSLPTVRERQWQLARTALTRAIAIDPSDRRLRAALRYCEGHLHRINGEAAKARKELVNAQRELSEAVSSFREAAELRPGWPDPFLGLARTFIYGFEDLERGADAVEQARHNGYADTGSESAQLGDGYRVRGLALERGARQLSGMPQEREYLLRSADAYRQALTLYSKAGSVDTIPAGIRLAQRSLTRVEERLSMVTEPTPADTSAPGAEAPPTETSPASPDPGESASASR